MCPNLHRCGEIPLRTVRNKARKLKISNRDFICCILSETANLQLGVNISSKIEVLSKYFRFSKPRKTKLLEVTFGAKEMVQQLKEYTAFAKDLT